MPGARAALPLAPDFPPGLPWLNVDEPLTLEALRGKVVVLDFWTYGCVNCLHVAAELKTLEQRFGDSLVVIGVHTPKFDNERNLETLRRNMLRYDLRHPVVQDERGLMMEAYGAIAWPSLAVIDIAGRYVALGRGHLPRRLLIGGMTLVWSLRLAVYLYRRVMGHHPLEDGRYQQLRQAWAPKAGLRFFVFFELLAHFDLGRFLNTPIITFAGKISKTKGIDYLLRANRIIQKQREAAIVVFGAGDLEDVMSGIPSHAYDMKNVIRIENIHVT